MDFAGLKPGDEINGEAWQREGNLPGPGERTAPRVGHRCVLELGCPALEQQSHRHQTFSGCEVPPVMKEKPRARRGSLSAAGWHYLILASLQGCDDAAGCQLSGSGSVGNCNS